MRTRGARRLVAALALPLVLALGACGSDDDDDGGDGGGGVQNTGAVVEGKRGGALEMLYAADVDYMDPGAAYYQYSINIMWAMHRTLYQYEPGDAKTPVPDLADGEPQITDGGRTVTVRLKRGIRFAPPVNREITSADVKYAFERAFTPNVTSGYATAYFGNLEGLPDEPKAGDRISGLQTPDDHTIVFKLTEPTGGLVAAALVMPISAPVPREYALEFDRRNPSTYGENVVASGPYMVRNNAEGRLVGYKPTRSIELVRNPNWDRATDFKPAYLDRITINEGNDDVGVAVRRIASGRSMAQGDFQIPPAQLKTLATGDQKDQLVITPPTGRVRYVSLNTTIEPFDDINVRKAVSAVMDRNAMRLAFGGSLVGDIPTHFISPGLPGYEEAGGAEGPGVDFLAKPEGDPELAAEYMRKAGYESGRYDGDERFLMVADNAGNQLNAAQVAQRALTSLGFKVNFRAVVRDTMYTRFCQVPKANVAICPSVGWLKDFSDGQSVLDPTFNGKNIQPSNNVNWPELDVPAINRAMDRAATLVEPGERARAWGQIDRQVTEQAAGVPWLWDKQPYAISSNVNGVINQANAAFDLSYVSLK